MRVTRTLFVAPILAVMLLGSSGLHALLEWSGGCGHSHGANALCESHFADADAQDAISICCHGHSHGPKARARLAETSSSRSATSEGHNHRPFDHDSENCVICEWAVAGHFFQYQALTFSQPLTVPRLDLENAPWTFVSLETPLSRGPPA